MFSEKIKKKKKEQRRKKNTRDLKYQTALEQNIIKADKIIDLQDKVITLQNQIINLNKENKTLKLYIEKGERKCTEKF